ncbi:MAG: ferrous iron transport protein A [Deltaproteobacteria bacterium]|nr:ferrous iron transport protein A [Deltaproteobacteria bacterium]MBW1874497.1 ferrous iron transport protein A [Deltaproteobacteria bacterium]MBW2210292.1 ferrous iron transport protein A [Deltaproteobacteria bacterium]MBW2213389.1 ferrous iron transport protein A [Deltaproteobacteria bacterium]MBW2378860.1 ferrous iron transport protein A [Deltaproteobacteria bacterium]
MKTSLADLPVGQPAEIASIDCERRISRRLMEMGLLPGTHVRVVRVAPLGDPIELRVRNYSLSLRRAEAAQIAVSPEETV